MFIASGIFYLADPVGNWGYVGIVTRVGILLSVIWLAMPQLQPLKEKFSTFALSTTLFLLIIGAARPNWFRIAAVILALTLIVNWVLRVVGKLANSQKKS